MKTDLDKATIGTCENCHTEKVWVRRVESKASEFMGGPRGWFNICFECFGPVGYFSGGSRGPFESPLQWSKEKVQKYLEDRRKKVE